MKIGKERKPYQEPSIKLGGSSKPKKDLEERVARLERENRQLQKDLSQAIRRIPNANLPVPGYRPICHAHDRIC